MKISVLFVCLGNICRSPLAMNIFIQHVREKGLENNFKIDSCGTSNYHIGSSPDPRTIENARQNGLEIDHKARQFQEYDLDDFDYILAMDQTNLEKIRNLDMDNVNEDKIFLMRDFDPENKGAEVPDPYFGGEKGFQQVYDILQRSSSNFLNYLKEKHQLKA